jgi:hypothetical protein
MSETEVTVLGDVWPRALLEALVTPECAGIATDALGQRCVYCKWQHEEYPFDVDPRHDSDCPILLGRAELKARTA